MKSTEYKCSRFSEISHRAEQCVRVSACKGTDQRQSCVADMPITRRSTRYYIRWKVSIINILCSTVCVS